MASAVPEIIEGNELVSEVMRAVARGQRVTSPIGSGYTYWQISQAIKLAVSLNLLHDAEGKLSITAQGLKHLRRQDVLSKSRILGPKEDQRIATIDLDDTYLPSRRTLETIKVRTSN